MTSVTYRPGEFIASTWTPALITAQLDADHATLLEAPVSQSNSFRQTCANMAYAGRVLLAASLIEAGTSPERAVSLAQETLYSMQPSPHPLTIRSDIEAILNTDPRRRSHIYEAGRLGVALVALSEQATEFDDRRTGYGTNASNTGRAWQLLGVRSMYRPAAYEAMRLMAQNYLLSGWTADHGVGVGFRGGQLSVGLRGAFNAFSADGNLGITQESGHTQISFVASTSGALEGQMIPISESQSANPALTVEIAASMLWAANVLPPHEL